MAAPREERIAEQRIEAMLPSFPFYIQEYIRDKRRYGNTPSTQLDYLYDFRIFFEWLLNEGLSPTSQSISEIPYSILATLRKQDVEFFIDFVRDKPFEVKKDVWKKRSVTRVIRITQSLKSLFRYLTEETELENGECYFDRNVMTKIKIGKTKETAKRRSQRISTSLLNDQDIEEFIMFLKNEYEMTLTPRQKAMYMRNKERDIALISLMLGSGIRVSEAAGLLMSSINHKKNTIDVTRKGGKEDTVLVLPSTMDDLRAYLNVRSERYQPNQQEAFVFLTRYQGKAQQISIRSIEANINQYTRAFTSGRSMSPHKLRHSFAGGWLRNGGDIVKLRDQLGHSSIETTALYTNLKDDESISIVERMDKSRRNDQISD
ncbi:tyrosine recombinase XerS [Domibacillus sp. A3M-37]|uniref:tyrosine recombinase XerS n=1 Tax=Domibacillus sp. A3M-37 TaxID=2962037 RepID=UPI0020B88B9B|nr:tyrosine recombinase XerS [Domibacillus sp. A3M-37]MCP3763775.1 tyrosine recombinase XerS [Domibacillus sp. A3M-37]